MNSNIGIINSIFTEIIKLQKNNSIGITGSIQYRDNNNHLMGNTSFTYTNKSSIIATGLINTDSNSFIIIGTNTLFKTELKRGDNLILTDNTIIGEISSINSNTLLNLVNNSTITRNDVNFYTSDYNIMTLDGDLLPTKTNTYSLGSEELYWAELKVGPGTISLVSKNNKLANIGLDANGIIYLDSGVSTQNIIITQTPTNVDEFGGWLISAIIDPINNEFDLVAQQIAYGTDILNLIGDQYSIIKNKGQTGDTGSIGNTGSIGPTGYIGPTGPVGASIHIHGNIISTDYLPNDADIYSGYIINGELWVAQKNNPIFNNGDWSNVGIIQGTQGQKGDTGLTGLTGIKGDTGQKGDTGSSNLIIDHGSVITNLQSGTIYYNKTFTQLPSISITVYENIHHITATITNKTLTYFNWSLSQSPSSGFDWIVIS